MVLCLVDEPEGIYYGGTVCAPIVKEFLENALPYLGVKPNYSTEESGETDALDAEEAIPRRLTYWA